MKLNRTYLYILLSSAALLTVLIIQVSWILRAAEIKEQLFNEKASMVLAGTAQALSADTATYKSLELGVSKSEVRKIDSIFHYYMKLYNVQIGYYFEVKAGLAEGKLPHGGDTYNWSAPGCWTGNVCLPAVQGQEAASTSGGKGVELKLVFPDKEQFILEEMSVPFVTSVVLILVVLVMSWRTTVSLVKEKEISEHTTDFLNNMTHEFKTPLTNISLAGKMMMKEQNIKQEEKVRHYSGIILEENEKLARQVEQVLSMTALERGEIPLVKEEVDLQVLLSDCLKCIHIQVEHKEGLIQLDLKAGRPMVLGDKTHLTNAFCNLVDNAIKYSGDKPQVRISTMNEGENLIVLVADKGIGIGEEYHARVFEKFFRVPTGNVHDVKGFGMGLAYVKNIIDSHGGRIQLESKKGTGTTFKITLPNA